MVVNFLISLQYVDPSDRSRTSPDIINHVIVVTILSLANAPLSHPGLSSKRTFQKDFGGDLYLVTMIPVDRFSKPQYNM
jgi:hypothetical protein